MNSGDWIQVAGLLIAVMLVITLVWIWFQVAWYLALPITMLSLGVIRAISRRIPW